MKKIFIIVILLASAITVFAQMPRPENWFSYHVTPLVNQAFSVRFVVDRMMSGERTEVFWDFGNSEYAKGDTVYTTYNHKGKYNISLYILENNSVIDTINATIYISERQDEMMALCNMQLRFNLYSPTQGLADGSIAVSAFLTDQGVDYDITPRCYIEWESMPGAHYNGVDSISGLPEGIYCVRIFDEVCESWDCINLKSDHRCDAEIVVDSTLFDINTSVYVLSPRQYAENTTYAWSIDSEIGKEGINRLFFDDSEVHQICLRTKSQYNCSDSSCLDTEEIISYGSITGTVHTNNSTLLPQGIAILFRYKDDIYFPVNTSDIQNGRYQFLNIEYGNYLIQLLPNFDIEGAFFPKYIATYQYGDLKWQSSLKMDVMSDTSVTTTLFKNSNYYFGEGKISGDIVLSIMEHGYNFIEYYGSENIENWVVLLKDKDKNVLNFTKTDFDGHYDFDNLELGEYFINVEMPGFMGDDIAVSLTSGDYLLDNIDIMVDEQWLSSGTSLFYEDEEMQIFPIPAKDELSIFVGDRGLKKIYVYNIQGLLVEYFDFFGNEIILDISDYSSGVYVVKAISEKSNYTQRIVISE